MTTRGLRLVLGVATASIALGIASTAALATAGLGNPGRPFFTAPPSCDVPALPGAVVDVTFADMPGTMMGPGMGPGMMGLRPSGQYRSPPPRDTRGQACK